jgi:hypothetical protein
MYHRIHSAGHSQGFLFYFCMGDKFREKMEGGKKDEIMQ